MVFSTNSNNESENNDVFSREKFRDLKKLVKKLGDPDFYINEHPGFLEEFFVSYNWIFLFYFRSLASQILSKNELEIPLYTSGQKNKILRNFSEICNFPRVELNSKYLAEIYKCLSTVWFRLKLDLGRVMLSEELVGLTEKIENDKRNLLNLPLDAEYKKQLNLLSVSFYFRLVLFLEVFAARQVLAETFTKLKDFSLFSREVFQQIITLDFYLVRNLFDLLSFFDDYVTISKKNLKVIDLLEKDKSS